jgi:hypothetical protein
MTEYKCGSAKQCQFGEMCKPSYDIGGCNHFKQKKPPTNEEYLRSCTTEQLAEVLNKIFMTRTFCHICPEGGVCDIGYECKYHGGNTKDFVEWLKQPHKPIS